jgi:hypothetical protein
LNRYSGRVLAAARIVEEGVGVQPLVAAEVAQPAAVLTGAAAGGERDEAAARPAVLGLVVRREHFDFLERVRVDRDQPAGVVPQIQVGDAIDGVFVLQGSGAVNVELPDDVRDGGGSDRAAGDDPGHQLHQVGDVAPVQRNLAQLPVGDQVGPLPGLGLNLHPADVRCHRHDLGEAADLEHEVAGVHLRRRRQDDVALHDLLEAAQLRGDLVGAGRQLRKDERPLAAGLHGPGHRQRGVDQRDGCAGERGAALILDRPADRSGVLPEGERGEQEDAGRRPYRGRRRAGDRRPSRDIHDPSGAAETAVRQ